MEYLPISKSVKIYKTSKTALTRLANKNIDNKSIRKENGVFLLSVELLESKYEKRVSSSAKESQTHANHRTEHTEPQKESIGIQTSNQSDQKKESEKIGSELVNVLKSQNEFLQGQITEKDSQIKTLLQRQSEQNIIIQSLQNNLSQKIDSSVPLLVNAMKENKEVAPGPEKQNDNGFTIASAVMILLLVVMIIVFFTVQ